MNEANERSNIIYRILQQDASLQLSWAQKKEVAVWAATIFYIGVIYVLFKSFVTGKSNTELEINFFIVIILNSLFLISIIFFVWSNFNSIYNSNAYYLSVKRTINKHIETGEEIQFHNSKPETYVDPDIINSELQIRLAKIQPYFHDLSRPLKISSLFWLNLLLPKRCKISIGENLAFQEAVLYSLLFVPTIFFWLTLFLNK